MSEKFLKRVGIYLGIFATLGGFVAFTFRFAVKPILLEAKVDNVVAEQVVLKKSAADARDFIIAQGEINKSFLAGQDKMDRKLDRLLMRR